MRRIFLIILLGVLVQGVPVFEAPSVGLHAGLPVRSQISDSERRKREQFLRARERIIAPPAATPTPRPRPTATPTPRATPRSTPRPAPRTTPEPTREATPQSTPRSRPTPAEKVRPTPRPKPTPKPRATPKPKERAPVVVQKSGMLEDEGFEPPPKRERRGFFSRKPKYRYLSQSVRDRIDKAPVKRNRWKYIIIHNSATRQGNAKIFGYYHKNVRKMQNGLAYHFVIGNGSSTGDGEIEIGDRWTRQINGGHVASDYLNNISLGICLVGDYDRDLPTRAQIMALGELTQYLRRRVGRIEGRASIVKAHKQINPKPTSCPGKRFPYDWLKRNFDR